MFFAGLVVSTGDLNRPNFDGPARSFSVIARYSIPSPGCGLFIKMKNETHSDQMQLLFLATKMCGLLQCKKGLVVEPNHGFSIQGQQALLFKAYVWGQNQEHANCGNVGVTFCLTHTSVVKDNPNVQKLQCQCGL